MKKITVIASIVLTLTTLASCTSSSVKSSEVQNPPTSSKSVTSIQITEGSLRASPQERSVLFLMKDPQGISQEQIFTYDLLTQKIQRKTFVFGRVFEADYKSENEIIFLSNTDLIKEKPRYLYPQNNEHSSGDIYQLSEVSQPRLKRITNTGTETELSPFLPKTRKTDLTPTISSIRGLSLKEVEEAISKCLERNSPLNSEVNCSL